MESFVHSDLEKLLETTPEAILVVGCDRGVRYVNGAAVELFRVSRQALMGEPLGFAFKEGHTAEIDVPRLDGARSCEMRVVSLAWKGEPALLASIRDVTDRKSAEELRARAAALEQENRRVEQAGAAKERLLATLSHELRTPLNAIIGFAQLLHDGAVPPSSPQHREFLGDILSSGRHLLQLVNDVLDRAKSEAGMLELHPEPTHLPALIREVVGILRPASADRSVTIDVQVEPGLTVVVIDPLRFKQVLYNYLSNALRFAPEGGRVAVRIREEDEHSFRLEVADDGPGIGPADQAKLFVEFHQIRPGLATACQGSGLGLALTRRLVEEQGGLVGVESLPGEGSVFFAVLPRKVVATPVNGFAVVGFSEGSDA